MKSTDMVRKVEELGRSVLSKERRQDMNMSSYLSGEVTDENISRANGKLVISAEEAEQLANEILGFTEEPLYF